MVEALQGLKKGESDDEDDAAESSDSDDDFITEDEIQSLDYIKVNKASALYANDNKGFLELHGLIRDEIASLSGKIVHNVQQYKPDVSTMSRWSTTKFLNIVFLL
ncbi:hypothetical protein AC1031_010305 [Aphanomyces cochlioides]|nr:hypothetical protein AC1031_010305 [Aphanomyces cochlioides]